MKTVTASVVMSLIVAGCAVDEGQTIQGTSASYLVPKEFLRDKFRYAFMRSIRGDGKKVVSLELPSVKAGNADAYRLSIYHDPDYIKRRGLLPRVTSFAATARRAGRRGENPRLIRFIGRHGKALETWFVSFDPASGKAPVATDFLATQPRKEPSGPDAASQRTCTIVTMTDGLLLQMAIKGDECALDNFAQLAAHARGQLDSWRSKAL